MFIKDASAAEEEERETIQGVVGFEYQDQDGRRHNEKGGVKSQSDLFTTGDGGEVRVNILP